MGKPAIFFFTGLGFVVLGTTCIFFSLKSTFAQNAAEIIDETTTSKAESESLPLMIEVAGAVSRPGVYSLPSGSRVADALAKAGGISTNADLDFVSRSINKAAKLVDSQKIYIPEKGSSSVMGVTGSGLININSAPQGELEDLPGIGPVTAEKIITGRPYGDIEELLSKKIVNTNVFGQIKDKVSVY